MENKLYPESSVEIRGKEAKYYGIIMNLMTGGLYNGFIKNVIKQMKIQPDDKILDLGAGNGYNACIMKNYLSGNGLIQGLDIGEDMINTFNKKCDKYNNINVLKQRIDEPFSFDYKFDKIFISFVLHGLPYESQLKVIENVYNNLDTEGSFFILDYNEFDIREIPFYKRKAFEFIECPMAFEYIKKDWKDILLNQGFVSFEEKTYFLNMVRLLKVQK